MQSGRATRRAVALGASALAGLLGAACGGGQATSQAPAKLTQPASLVYWAILGGVSLVHQFVHIGAHAFIGMGARLSQDVPPFVTVAGAEPRPFGINSEGLKRRGFSAEDIGTLKSAYRSLYRKGLSLEDARRELEALAAGCGHVRQILDFLAKSERGILR